MLSVHGSMPPRPGHFSVQIRPSSRRSRSACGTAVQVAISSLWKSSLSFWPGTWRMTLNFCDAFHSNLKLLVSLRATTVAMKRTGPTEKPNHSVEFKLSVDEPPCRNRARLSFYSRTLCITWQLCQVLEDFTLLPAASPEDLQCARRAIKAAFRPRSVALRRSFLLTGSQVHQLGPAESRQLDKTASHIEP